MRRNELQKMERSWVDVGERLIMLPAHATKTRKARPVPLNDVALGIIRRRLVEGGHPR